MSSINRKLNVITVQTKFYVLNQLAKEICLSLPVRYNIGLIRLSKPPPILISSEKRSSTVFIFLCNATSFFSLVVFLTDPYSVNEIVLKIAYNNVLPTLFACNTN